MNRDSAESFHGYEKTDWPLLKTRGTKAIPRYPASGQHKPACTEEGGREREREAQQRTLTEIGNRNESENNDTLRHPSDSNSTCPMNSLLFCTVRRTNQREWQGKAEGNRKWVPRERQKNDRSMERKGGLVMEVNDIAC